MEEQLDEGFKSLDNQNSLMEMRRMTYAM